MPREPIFGERQQRTIYLPVELHAALIKAQGHLHMTGNGLFTQIIREWLAENSYLPEREEVKT
ncbi:hypothetical protein LCGC14_2122540 [marine sediment metagenome]|uniref:Uncharacterized protein n=1 Tax=marine sediment metagenome TaxID=412755 RepID=A0A0F9H013_9ZZZZ